MREFKYEIDEETIKSMLRNIEVVRELARIVWEVNLYCREGFMTCEMIPEQWEKFKARLEEATDETHFMR